MNAIEQDAQLDFRISRAADVGVTVPAGFRAAGVACGIKKSGALDLTLIVPDAPAIVAAMFTTSKAQAAPVLVSRDHLDRSLGVAGAIVVNSGCANACTGAAGLEVAPYHVAVPGGAHGRIQR